MSPRSRTVLACVVLALALLAPSAAMGAIGTVAGAPVAGVFVEGKSLSYTPPAGYTVGTTLNYRWQKCTSPLATSCVDLGSGFDIYRNNPSLALTLGDVDSYFRVREVKGATTEHTAIVGPVVHDTVTPGAIVIGGEPVIAENVVNDTAAPLTVSAGAGWITVSGGTPTSSYEWYRCTNAGDDPAAVGAPCGVAVSTSSSYSPVAADAGKYMVAVLTGTNTAGGDSHSATARAASPVIDYDDVHAGAAPAITGVPISGEELTATIQSAGWATLSGPIAHTVTWYRCPPASTPPLGAGCTVRRTEALTGGDTTSTLGLIDTDAGRHLFAIDTGSNPNGSPDSATSLATALVALDDDDGNGHRPTITGTLKAGSQLTATSSLTWAPAGAPFSPIHTFRWYRCTTAAAASCSATVLHTGPTYTLIFADAGKYIRVIDSMRYQTTPAGVTPTAASANTVTTRKIDGSVSHADVTAGSAPVITAPNLVGTTVLTGISGERLTATVAGSWNPGPTGYTLQHQLQWFLCNNDTDDPRLGACGAAVKTTGPGALVTSSTYDPSDEDQGKYLKVVDTGSNQYGQNATKVSLPVLVAFDDLADHKPDLAFDVLVIGHTLTVTTSSNWNPSSDAPPFTHSFQWYRCSSTAFASCSTIAGATGTTYTLQQVDFTSCVGGCYITVVDTATDGTVVVARTVTTKRSTAYAVDTYPGIVKRHGATNYWRLNETGKAKVADDEVAGGENAEYRGVKRDGDGAVSGDGNFSRKFLGRGYIFANGVEVDDAAYSVEAWIKPADSGAASILDHGGNGALYIDSAGKVVFLAQGAKVVSATGVSSNQWHHVVGVYDSDTESATLYVDGIARGTVAATTEPVGAPTFYIGRSDHAPGFRGSIDEVALYRRDLTAAQVAQHYAAATRA